MDNEKLVVGKGKGCRSYTVEADGLVMEVMAICAKPYALKRGSRDAAFMPEVSRILTPQAPEDTCQVTDPPRRVVPRLPYRQKPPPRTSDPAVTLRIVDTPPVRRFLSNLAFSASLLPPVFFSLLCF